MICCRSRGIDAVRDRLAALIPPIEPTSTRRPTATIEEVRAGNTGSDRRPLRGSRPTAFAADRRHQCRQDAHWRSRHSPTSKPSAVASATPSSATIRMEHHVSQHAAEHVADNAGLPLLRCRYFAETHELVGQTLEYARSLGLTTAHDGGYDQPLDPAKPGPPACTEHELRDAHHRGRRTDADRRVRYRSARPALSAT